MISAKEENEAKKGQEFCVERVLREGACGFRIFREGLPALSQDLEEGRGEPCGNLREAFWAEGIASGRALRHMHCEFKEQLGGQSG